MSMTRTLRPAMLPTVVVAVAALLAASQLPAQVQETNEIERLSADQLGAYRPEHDPDLADVSEQIVERTNAFREEQDLSPLATDETLTRAAKNYADFMASEDLFGHTADGRRPGQRAQAAGYEYCVIAENVAYQFSTTGFRTETLAEKFVTGWKQSPGHRENMLTPYTTETGVAVSHSEATGAFYAVQLFGRPQSKSIEFELANKTEQSVAYELGERRLELPPRYVRIHEMCRPSSLRIHLGEDDQKRVKEVQPESGWRLMVVPSDNGVEVVRQNPDGDDG